MDTKQVLKMVFGVELSDGDKKSRTVSLEDPKTDLSADDVKAFMNKAIAKSAILISGEPATSIKEAFVEVTTKTPIIVETEPTEVTTDL